MSSISKRENLPEGLKCAWEELLMDVDTNIKLSSVILTKENKMKVNTFIEENIHREELAEYGLKAMNKLLLYGQTGTGKTYLSKALCNHLGYTMMYIDIADSLSKGNVAENISNIFRIANALGKCMIFLDECDSIVWSRDAKSSDGGDVRRATNSIFQYLDQMDNSNIFISATNMLHRIDPAFERRFDMKLEFRRPDRDLIEIVRHFMLPKFKLVDNTDSTTYEILSRRIKDKPKLNYYEIQCVVERQMKRSVISGTNIVYTNDIYEDLKSTLRIKIEYEID